MAYFSSLDARSRENLQSKKVIEPGQIGIMKIVKANDYATFNRGINNDERSLVNV